MLALESHHPEPLPRYANLEIDAPETDLEEFAREIGVQLHLVSSKDQSAVKVTRFKNGITNKLLKVSLPSKKIDYMIRIYGVGTGLLIDRNAEIENLQILSSRKLAPPLYARLLNAMVYGYVPGVPCPTSAVSHPKIWPKIALHLAQWHDIPLSTLNDRISNQLLSTLDQWLNLVIEKTGSSTLGIPVADLRTHREHLVSKLPHSPLTFNHNDLLCGNIILQHDLDVPSSDDQFENVKMDLLIASTRSVRFIDYEYGCVGPAAFDIANHFCEWGGLECDYSRYPSIQMQRAWISTYLQARRLPNDQPSVDLWVQNVAHYTTFAHFYWTLWALIQDSVSHIDFDYAQYAKLRWGEYEKRVSSWS